MSRRFLASVTAALAVAAGAVLTAGVAPAKAVDAPHDPTVPYTTTITTRDGIVLKALYMEPGTPGKHPMVIAPSAWGGAVDEYVELGKVLVKRGYVLVGYAERGIEGSGGTVDVAGPATVGDVSDVIDWALAHTTADPNRIGLAGVSYGAAISMMAAAKDPRVRAVADLSGWTDLEASLHANNTSSQAVAAGLLLSGATTSNLGDDTIDIFKNIIDDTDIPRLSAWAIPRSPITYVAQINQNKPAILMASGENETVFPTSTTVKFWNELTVPNKRLWLHPGDHASAEDTAQYGLDNTLLNDVYRWFDNYLAGTDDSMKNEPAVRIEPRRMDGPSPTEFYPDWAAASRSTQSLPLGGPVKGGDGTATLGGTPAAGWTDKIIAGIDTSANVGIPLVTYSLDAFFGEPPRVDMSSISRAFGAVWQSPALTAPVYLRGQPKLHLTLKSSAPAGTVIAYLYDVDQNGTGGLIAGVPYSWLNQQANVPFTFDLPFQASGYDIPAGHRIAVVIDTKDILWKDHDSFGQTLTFTSPAGDPSRLDLPLR